MATLYREFTLKSPGIWPTVLAFIKSNAAACAERGEPLRLIVTVDERRRNVEQNKKLHAMLKEIAENAWWEGRQYPMEFWKEYYRRRFLLKDEFQTPEGEIVQTYWSTSDLSVKKFSEFIESIHMEAARDFGIDWNV